MIADHIEFHAPSEHKFNKLNTDLEMQIYFNLVTFSGDPKMKTIAVSFFFDSQSNKENSFLKQFITPGVDPVGKTHKIDLSSILTIDMVNK